MTDDDPKTTSLSSTIYTIPVKKQKDKKKCSVLKKIIEPKNQSITAKKLKKLEKKSQKKTENSPA